MKQLLILVIILVGVHGMAAPYSRLDSLLVNRDFFRLRDELQQKQYKKLSDARKLYYQAFVHNFFHDLELSSKEIYHLVNKYSKEFSDKEISSLLTKQIDNHIKLYQYRLAHEISQLMLTKYEHVLSAEEKEEINNSDVIWKSLQNVAPQQAIVDNDTHIAGKRDMARLLNIPVQFGDSTFQFVFDTGANISVVSETYAGKSNMELLHSRFKVRAITGLEVMADLALAKSLKIGSITLSNVVFMVFPDSALSFLNGIYKINGIIGFPVIEQLQEVRIAKGDTLTIPREAVKKDIGNFGIDGLAPVLNTIIAGDTLAFTFDTGAQTTVLNQPYYRKYKAAITQNGTAFQLKEGGAGGTNNTTAYRLPSITFDIHGQPVTIKNVAVKTTHAGTTDNFYFGNLGQDVMTQFKEMVINFKYMYVLFEK
ncbi:MAG: pepsin/retropepsin-like aspartic protease family protein [Chitinophagaceae bacterium]